MRTSFFAIIVSLFALPLVTLAQAKYTPLVNIPGITDGGGDTFSKYIEFLYALSISIAALIAVIKIIIAGVKYMLTDVVTSKGEAIKEIKGALLGLLVILGAIVILSTVNPQLLRGGLTFGDLPPDTKVFDRSSVAAGGTSGAPGLNTCVRQTVQQGNTFYSTTECPAAVDRAAEAAKFEAWCKNTAKGTYRGGAQNGSCAPIIATPAPGGGTSTSTSGTPIPPKNCTTVTTRKNGAIDITVYNFSACDNTYRFISERNKTALQLAKEAATATCGATLGTRGEKGRIISQGPIIFECHVYNP